MRKNNDINISVIIPIFNVEEFLPACIESLLHQVDLYLEIILVNDGSTDRSGEIADRYASIDSRIRTIHQGNGGASAARNAGLVLAQGEYIAFVDSDDWVKENSLCELYREATKNQSDVVMGKMWYCYQDGTMHSPPFNPIPEEIFSVPLSGKECFIRSVKAGAYLSMACNYVYRRKYLQKIQARFEENIMHEDELWTPIALCQAEKVVILDIDFYYYRQRKESVMHVTNHQQRLNSLFRVTDRLIEFADCFDFSGEDEELKIGCM